MTLFRMRLQVAILPAMEQTADDVVPEESKSAPKYNLRMPPGMRERIKEAKAKSGRSMNAELVARLETSFDFEPAQMLAMMEQLKSAIEQLTATVDELGSRLDKL